MDRVQARWRVVFEGRVQHVGFRYTALYLARGLGLTGWVSNRADGTVLMEVQGPAAEIRKMLMRLKSQPHLHITHTGITELETVPGEKQFRVR